MILRMPEYCFKFHCIAGDCSDSCCIGWEIDIDSKTAELYNNTGGEFGERLRKNISRGRFVLDSRERCPFLNDRNLCDIIINLGEESLCQICTDHPRYYEWFDGLKEGGIGLCCEEAARLVLTDIDPLKFRDIEITAEDCDLYDSELYSCLYSARAKIMERLGNCGAMKSLKTAVSGILEYGKLLQENIDNGDFLVPEIPECSDSFCPDTGELFGFLLTLEPIDEKWQPYVRLQLEKISSAEMNLSDFEECNPEIGLYLRNIGVYYLWRYFMKGVFDGEILSWLRYGAASIVLLEFMFFGKWLETGTLSLSDCVELTKNYSKETEYSEENIENFRDAVYEMKTFRNEKS